MTIDGSMLASAAIARIVGQHMLTFLLTDRAPCEMPAPVGFGSKETLMYDTDVLVVWAAT
jgi:hypothetical protein